MGRTGWRREREFGVAVGLVLLAAAAWFRWRGGAPLVVGVPGGIGALLVVLGAAWPRALVYPYRWWMALAEALSWVSTRVILGVLLYVVMTPLGTWRRWRGADPLARRAPADQRSFWHPYSARQRDSTHYEKMF